MSVDIVDCDCIKDSDYFVDHDDAGVCDPGVFFSCLSCQSRNLGVNIVSANSMKNLMRRGQFKAWLFFRVQNQNLYVRFASKVIAPDC